MANPKKIVPDSGLILQATLSPRGPSSQVLGLLDAGKIVVYLSPQTREEVEDILTRLPSGRSTLTLRIRQEQRLPFDAPFSQDR